MRPGRASACPLRLTRQAIADHLGLTIETVSRQLDAMRREGLVTLRDPRVVEIRDLGRLVRASGDEA